MPMADPGDGEFWFEGVGDGEMEGAENDAGEGWGDQIEEGNRCVLALINHRRTSTLIISLTRYTTRSWYD